MRKPLREKTQADYYGLMPHKNSSCQHELLSKVSLLGSRVEVAIQNVASKKKNTVFQTIIPKKLFLPHSLLTLLQPLETC